MVYLIAQGALTNDKQVRAAVKRIRQGEAQQSMFGDLPPAPTPEELATVSAMEVRIERVLAAVAGGWKDGECVIARKVGSRPGGRGGREAGRAVAVAEEDGGPAEGRGRDRHAGPAAGGIGG